MSVQRKVREDFDPSKKYSVDVSMCSENEKRAVQQAFFDVGISWPGRDYTYQQFYSVQYSNTFKYAKVVTNHLMYSDSTYGCNMTAKEFLNLVYEPVEVGHVHAELMQQYVDDAKIHAKPWELWEFEASNGEWEALHSNPLWSTTTKYRQKSKTHTVSWVEIPDLRIEPTNGDSYWFPRATCNTLVCGVVSCCSERDLHRIKHGLCYEFTEEGKQAAIIHAKAWLGIT